MLGFCKSEFCSEFTVLGNVPEEYTVLLHGLLSVSASPSIGAARSPTFRHPKRRVGLYN